MNFDQNEEILTPVIGCIILLPVKISLNFSEVKQSPVSDVGNSFTSLI